MKHSYRLLLVGCFVPWKVNSSCEFFSKEFLSCFSKLPHVSISTAHFDDNMSKVPEADVALVHAYADSSPVANLSLLKERVKKTAYFMEVVPTKQETKGYSFDRYYYYDSQFSGHSFVRIPLVKKYYECLLKDPGSILLDHDGRDFPWNGNPHMDWNERIWAFFEKNQARYPNVWQLERGKVKRPSFIKTIKLTDHCEYLKATARFERFVCTHSGSYNHTAADMAVRGTHMLVPFMAEASQRTFVPASLLHDLSMSIYKNEEELDTLLQTPFEFRPKLDRATDLNDIVARMDSDFQQMLA